MWSTQSGRWIANRVEVVGVQLFSEDYRRSTVWSKIYLCSCKKIGLRKGMSHKATSNGVALMFRTC